MSAQIQDRHQAGSPTGGRFKAMNKAAADSSVQLAEAPAAAEETWHGGAGMHHDAQHVYDTAQQMDASVVGTLLDAGRALDLTSLDDARFAAFDAAVEAGISEEQVELSIIRASDRPGHLARKSVLGPDPREVRRSPEVYAAAQEAKQVVGQVAADAALAAIARDHISDEHFDALTKAWFDAGLTIDDA